MKSKKVTQYQCEFCDKKGLSASHIASHEKHCTMNPKRVCRVCKMDHEGQTATGQVPIETLLAILPEPSTLKKVVWTEISKTIEWDSDAVLQAMQTAIPQLRKISSNCPACILAALRQKGFCIPTTGFNFKAEMEAIWDYINDSRAEANEREEYRHYQSEQLAY